MNRRGLAQGVIDALPEPAFLLTREGGVIGANRTARTMLGLSLVTGDLGGKLATPADEFRRYLHRCGQTTTPLPGALEFRTAEGERRFRVHCGRLGGQMGDPLLLLRCDAPPSDRFSVLADRVRQLDSELRQRVREKAVLREALEQNRNLMRELQHRVKNNIQMMISLLSMSAGSSGAPDVRALVDGVKDRFRALATTQDLIYESQSSRAVPARELLGRLARALAESTNGGVEMQIEIADVSLPQDSAHCLALILNELVTNSIKHGLNGGAAKIKISLERDGEQLRLSVQDNGPGYPPPDAMRRSSGLTLIRGLCRQIGAALDLTNRDGARSVVTFPDTGVPGSGSSRENSDHQAVTSAST